MALDFTKIILSIFLLSAGRADSKGADCPSNTVEIVFTKNGVICATTSSVPELNHLSVDPKHIPNLLGEPQVVQKVSLPVLTHPMMSVPPPPQHLIFQQMPDQNIGHEMQILTQPIPVQPLMGQPLVAEFMDRRLPLHHENTINQNMDYTDRRPNLMEDKRAYYQKMLWDKLRRDALIKKLFRSNPNQLFGIQYIDDQNNNDNNNYKNTNYYQSEDLPQETTEEQTQNSQQMSQNSQNIETEKRPDSAQTSQEGQVSDDQPNNNENNYKNEYNDNQSQEPIGLDENSNEKEQVLKDYLKYLNKNDDIPQEEQNTEQHRDSRHYDMGSTETNSRVPEIIRGYMPGSPIGTNGHTYGMKLKKASEYSADEPAVSGSQVSFQFVAPDERPYNQKLMKAFRFPQNEENDKSLRLVGSGMTFGHRLSSQNSDPMKFGYGYKSYPEYNDEKAKRFRAKSKYLVNIPIKNEEQVEDDVVLVTADPNQREIIETLEAQNSRRNQRKFSDDWNGSRGSVENNAIDYQMNKDFRIDESRIEYNGWRPLRLQSRQSELEDSHKEEEEETMKSSSSAKVISILPITGRVNNNWKAI